MAFFTDLKFVNGNWVDYQTNDVFFGGNNGDVVSLHGGNDAFYGGTGNDVAYDFSALSGGWGGDDVIALGAGNDTLITAFDLPNNLGAGQSHQGYYGGIGTDSIDFSIDTTTGVVVDLNLGYADSTIVSYQSQVLGFENVTGTNFGDYINGDSGNNVLSGLSGGDSISGQGGDDNIYGGDGFDTLHGNDGNDFMTGDAGNDAMYGDAGNDTMYGGDGTDFIYGGDGNDYSLGGNGDDLMYGNAGDDNFFGQDGKDVIFGGTGNDRVYGEGDDDIVYGNNGNDNVYGGIGNDYVYGGAGSDNVYGGDGNDLVNGGYGKDFLYGGSGADTFEFKTLNDSAPLRANADVIVDFQHHVDKIDVSGIDANRLQSGDQAFHFIGDHAFTQAGQISSHYDSAHNETVVSFNTDHDSAAEMKLVLQGHITLSSSDFIL